MRPIFKLVQAGVLSIGLMVAACQVPAPLQSLENLLTSQQGQSLVTNLLTGVMPQLDAMIAEGAGQMSQADLQKAVYWSNWLEVAVNTFAPFIPNFTPTDVAAVNQIISDLQADASAPVPDTKAVVQDISTLVKDLQPLITAVTAASPASVPAPVPAS